jgi:hypothetical protein
MCACTADLLDEERCVEALAMEASVEVRERNDYRVDSAVVSGVSEFVEGEHSA